MRLLIALMASVVGLAQTLDWRTQLKNRPFVDVTQKPYSAKGDGTTNDRAAIAAAITAAGEDGVIYFPAGDYKINTGLTCLNGQTFWGEGAKIRAGANGITMLSCSGSDLKYVRIHGFRFIGADFSGTNTLTGISLSSGSTGQNSTHHTLEDLVFDNVRYAIKLDKVSDTSVRNIHLWNNSTIFSGSTTTGAADYAHNNTLSNITHYATVALTMSDPIITLTRAATNVIDNFYARTLYGTNKGILINGDSQSVRVAGGNIVNPSIGIDIDCSAPGGYWTNLSGVKIDQYATHGVKVGASCLYTSIDEALITGKNPPYGTEEHGILSYTNSVATKVTNSTFQNIYAGAALTADQNSIAFNFANNTFSNYAGSATFTADASTDTFTATAHPFLNNQTITVSNVGGALPSGLTAGVTYYIINKATNTFQLSLTVGGAAVNITSAGTGTQTAAGTTTNLQILSGSDRYSITGNRKDASDTAIMFADGSSPTLASVNGNSGITDKAWNNLELRHTNAGVVLGKSNSASTPFIDFFSSGLNTVYDCRINSSGGTASTGQGSLSIGCATVALSGKLINASIPTSCSGQVTGTLWSDAGTVKVCP